MAFLILSLLRMFASHFPVYSETSFISPLKIFWACDLEFRICLDHAAPQFHERPLRALFCVEDGRLRYLHVAGGLGARFPGLPAELLGHDRQIALIHAYLLRHGKEFSRYI